MDSLECDCCFAVGVLYMMGERLAWIQNVSFYVKSDFEIICLTFYTVRKLYIQSSQACQKLDTEMVKHTVNKFYF